MSRTRRIAIVCLFLLACVGLVGTTVAVWAHQVALNTDRWVSIVGPLARDPEVIAGVSNRLADQVVTGLDVQGRVANVMPAGATFLSGTLTQALHDFLQRQIARVLESDRFQAAWLTANRVVHEQVVRILRGDLGNVTITKGVVNLNLLGLIDDALHQLQAAGLIPATVVLPDISNADVPEAAITKIETALGVSLPDDFGQIPLFRSDRLATAQAAVKIFDLIVIGLALLTLILMVAVVLLARSRLRAIVALGIGAAVSLVAARLIIRGTEGALADALADSTGSTTVTVVIRTVMEDAVSLIGLVAVVAIVVAIVAYVLSRPAWAVRAAGAARSSTTQIAGAAAGATESASGGRAGLAALIRTHRAGLRWIGAGVVVFVIGFVAIGPELAILAAAMLGLYWIGLEVLGRPSADEPVSGG